MAVVWLVVGLGLAAFELHHLAFYAMFAAIGAFAAAAVAAFTPIGVPGQVLVGLAATTIGIVAARPFVSRVFDRRRTHSPVARGVHGGITGHEVVALDDIGDSHHPGHVRMAGERWLAVSADGMAIGPGQRAIVTAVRGTTLVVVATDDVESPGVALPPPAPELNQPEHAPERADGASS